MFTRDQIEEIEKKLIMLGTKDTQFPDAHKLNGKEIIAIVQDGENKKIPLSSIINDDFINVSKDTTEILTLSTAISKIDTNNRKLGQVITFKDSANSWAIRQFTGGSLDNWNDISLWKSISGIDELKSQADTNTSNIESLNTEVSTLQSKVDENTTSISHINTELDNKNDEIAQINNTLAEHTDSINAKITTDRIEDGAVISEKIATSAFDSTLSVSGKIAPADVVGDKLADLGQQVESIHPVTDEAGYHVVDTVGNIGMQYTEQGFGAAKVQSQFVEVLKQAGVSTGSALDAVSAEVEEIGFFFVDEHLNVGVKVDSDDIHAKNIIEYEIINE